MLVRLYIERYSKDPKHNERSTVDGLQVLIEVSLTIPMLSEFWDSDVASLL